MNTLTRVGVRAGSQRPWSRLAGKGRSPDDRRGVGRPGEGALPPIPTARPPAAVELHRVLLDDAARVGREHSRQVAQRLAGSVSGLGVGRVLESLEQGQHACRHQLQVGLLVERQRADHPHGLDLHLLAIAAEERDQLRDGAVLHDVEGGEGVGGEVAQRAERLQLHTHAAAREQADDRGDGPRGEDHLGLLRIEGHVGDGADLRGGGASVS